MAINILIKANLIVSGRVQGVCYRMETWRMADLKGVSGWVKNLSDGKVEAVFEGEKASVEAMVQWCKKGPEGAHVANIDIKFEDYTGNHKGFKIIS